MEHFICNKCFAVLPRGKKPFCLTQCGHIYCQTCLRQAEKQCPQCNSVDAMSIPLTEPLQSKIAMYFKPLHEELENILKVCIFQNNQMQISMGRFYELDKKYELLKTQYWQVVKVINELRPKYYEIKAEKDRLQKKVMFLEMQAKSMYPKTSTPQSSAAFQNHNGKLQRGSASSLHKLNNITPVQHFKMTQEYNMSADGFRVPKPPSTGSTSRASNSSSGYCRRL